MKANLAGRVRNTSLPKTHPLLPLFEAVINSIDAIEEAGLSPEQGAIQVVVKRQPTLGLVTAFDADERSYPPIRSFEVHDNGIGFTEANYQAFNESDTQVKACKGGRGIGRFIWLKAFERVEIDSFFDSNGSKLRRAFTFSLETPDGISGHSLTGAPLAGTPHTTVALIDFKEEFERRVPRAARTIARHLLEHFLEYCVLTKMPPLKIMDDAEREPILLESLYDELVADSKHSTSTVEGHAFDLAHFFLRPAPGLSHRINYCANRRVVVADRIAGKVPNLPAMLPHDGKDADLIYAGYVSSDYLDSHVNQERTAFELVPEATGMFAGELAWSQVEDTVLKGVRDALAPFTDQVREVKQKRICEFVSTKAPEYRHIVKHHSDRLDAIPPDIPDEKLAVHLYEIQRDIEVQVKAGVCKILTPPAVGEEPHPLEEQLQRLSAYWDDLNDVGKANLAKYIVHRKYVLAFLENALKRIDAGKYSREEMLHRVVFPLKATSDDIEFDQHNLWIIDERLAYHRYLASDLPLSKIDRVDTRSQSRPDLLLFFDHAIAVADDDTPFHAGIVIFEFKRPMRDDYSTADNPIQQVLHYVEEIKEGKTTDKDGRPFRASSATPFYCYIVADITDTLKGQARYADLIRTPDGLGFFGYNKELGAYIEVIDFDKMIQDSKKRNRVLFEKLNLPDKLL